MNTTRTPIAVAPAMREALFKIAQELTADGDSDSTVYVDILRDFADGGTSVTTDPAQLLIEARDAFRFAIEDLSVAVERDDLSECDRHIDLVVALRDALGKIQVATRRFTVSRGTFAMAVYEGKDAPEDAARRLQSALASEGETLTAYGVGPNVIGADSQALEALIDEIEALPAGQGIEFGDFRVWSGE